MAEVVDDGVGQGLSHIASGEIEVVVMDDYDGLLGVSSSLLRHCVGKGLVHRHISIAPCIINGLVYVGIVGRVPHIVLKEPEEGVTEDAIELMINTAWGYYKAYMNTMAGEG